MDNNITRNQTVATRNGWLLLEPDGHNPEVIRISAIKSVFINDDGEVHLREMDDDADDWVFHFDEDDDGNYPTGEEFFTQICTALMGAPNATDH